MSVPASKVTSSKGGRRRSHDALKKVLLVKCPKCGKAVKPHMACVSCGTYKGRTVLKVKSKVKKEKK